MVASDCSATALGSTDQGVASIGMRTPSRHLHTADKYGFPLLPHCPAERAIAASPTRWRSQLGTWRSFSLQILIRCAMADSSKYCIFIQHW